MKRLIFLILITAMLGIRAYGTDELLYSSEDFELSGILESIPEEVAELLPENIFDPDSSSQLDVGFFAGVVKSLIGTLLGSATKSFSRILGLLLICTAISALRSAVKNECSGLFELISGICIMLELFTEAQGLFESVQSYLSGLTGIMDSFIPVMSAMCAAGGGLSAAAVSSGGLILGLDLIEKLAANGLMPMLRLCFGISIASGLGGGLKLSGISKLIRDGFSWILGLSAAAISAIMTFQTTIAARADSLSMRAVKFAASNAVPVAGGIAADAVRTVAGSLSLIKGTVGWAGVAIVVLLTLPMLMRVILTRLGVMLAGICADILGLERERGFLNELSGLLGFLCAVCLVASLMFIYALAVFAFGSVAIAG